MGIASGITQQKLSLSALATRYFMAGLVIMVLRGIITEQISVYLNQKKEGQKPTEEAVAEEKKAQDGVDRFFYRQIKGSMSFYV